MLNIRKIYRRHNENNQGSATDRRTCCGLIVKVRFKLKNDLLKTLLFAVFIIINFNVSPVKCNRPPRFLIDGQTEIVLRLKEGEETPVGKMNTNYFVSNQPPICLLFMFLLTEAFSYTQMEILYFQYFTILNLISYQIDFVFAQPFPLEHLFGSVFIADECQSLAIVFFWIYRYKDIISNDQADQLANLGIWIIAISPIFYRGFNWRIGRQTLTGLRVPIIFKFKVSFLLLKL